MSGESVLMELAERIGPRPATTDTEAQAADHLAELFSARGLEVDREDFECPRSQSWAFVLYHLLTIAAAVASRWFPLPALVLSAAVAVVLWTELDGRWGLSALLPKGPSQNIIGRHVPKTRRGERVRKVVIVAHYDSPRASLAFSPGFARNWWTTLLLTKGVTTVMPVLILLQLLPWFGAVSSGLWYLASTVAAWLLVPTLVALHSELLMPFTDGANDNASGVAALLEVLAEVVPEPVEIPALREPVVPPVRRTEEEARAADVVPEESILSYAPVETPRHAVGPFTDEDDIGWEEETRPGRGQETMEFEEPAEHVPASREEQPKRKGPKLPFGKKRERENGDVNAWLGLGSDFDARKEGRKIGSWDQFGEEEDDDGMGWKGGAAGDEVFEDPDFPALEAARIRRKVTATVDRSLAEKEVWFVATGAESVGGWGMRDLLDRHAEDLRDAYIINLECVGAGNLTWLTKEGLGRRHTGDRKLQSTAKRVAREMELKMRGVEYTGPETDATIALGRGYHALTLTAFDINGRQPNKRWTTDTVDSVSEENVTKAAEFVTAMVKDL